jgi:hypothetical protein
MAIELAYPIDRRHVERAHQMAIQYQKGQRLSMCEIGNKLARAQHPKLLAALDKAAEVMESVSEEQSGRMRRDPSTPAAYRTYPTEAALWREAYKMADSGIKAEQFGWIYGAAAWLAGMYEG